MLRHQLLLRLFPGRRVASQSQSLSSFPTPVLCRQSAVTLATVASRKPPPARPARPLDKINSRARQLADHFHSTTPPTSSAPIHTTAEPSSTMSYTTRKIAAANTLEHRIFIEKDGQLVSPWHDIPLYANEQQTVLNMIVEVPRWTNAKMEVRIPHPRAQTTTNTSPMSWY